MSEDATIDPTGAPEAMEGPDAPEPIDEPDQRTEKVLGSTPGAGRASLAQPWA